MGINQNLLSNQIQEFVHHVISIHKLIISHGASIVLTFVHLPEILKLIRLGEPHHQHLVLFQLSSTCNSVQRPLKGGTRLQTVHTVLLIDAGQVLTIAAYQEHQSQARLPEK